MNPLAKLTRWQGLLAQAAQGRTQAAAAVRAAVSFGVVLVAFGLYRVSVGWYLAPEAAPLPLQNSSEAPQPSSFQPSKELKLWFGHNPDAWELRNPKMLRTDRGILLFQRYKVLDRRRVKISPCSLVLLPSPKASPREAIVLQAPEGAILQFQRGFDLRRGQVGQLQGGLLLGQITIRSQGRSPRPDDDLWISTYDIQLQSQAIYTPHPVQFRLGPNYGSGRELYVQLAQIGRRSNKRLQLEYLELRSDVNLHLVPQPQKEKPTAQQKPNWTAPRSSNPLSLLAPGPRPLEITCEGAMRVDFVKRRVSFQRRVHAQRRWPQGPPDQLHADQLVLTFATEKPPVKKQAAQAKGSEKTPPRSQTSHWAMRWKVQWVEAKGHPARLEAPRSQVLVRAHRLAYHVPSGAVELEDMRQGLLQQGRNRLWARRASYRPGPEGRPGTFEAQGAGKVHWWLTRTANPPSPARRPPSSSPAPAAQELQLLEASWGKGMKALWTKQGLYQVEIDQQAQLRWQAQGELRARRIVFLLQPQQVAKNRWRLLPQQLQAWQSVRIDSAELELRCETLLVHFLTPGAQADRNPPVRLGHKVPRANPTHKSKTAQSPTRNLKRVIPTSGRVVLGLGQIEPVAQADRAPPLAPAPGAQARYELSGQEVQLWLLAQGKQTQPRRLVVSGKAQLRTVSASGNSKRSLTLRGEKIHGQNLNRMAQVVVQGNPAHLEAQGLILQGPSIHLDQSSNRLWVPSAGQMWLPVGRTWFGTSGTQEPLRIQWLGQMNFDGQKVSFSRGVVARRTNEHLQTETLEVFLQQPVSLAPETQQNTVQVARIACRQGVYAQWRRYEQGELVAWEQFRAADLSINQLSGAVVAQGPGYLRRISRSGAAAVVPGSSPSAAQARAGLWFLQIKFHKTITGNMHRREMLFSGQVEAVYGPVPHWQATLDADAPEQLGPQGLALHCQKLSVAQVRGGQDTWWLELQATGNTVVEGSGFTARAQRVAYSQAKDRLLLEGTARVPAVLQRWPYPGGPVSTAQARKILYWRRSNRLQVQDAQSLDLAQPPKPSGR